MIRDPAFNQTELFRQIGKTLIGVEVFEQTLAHYLALWAHKAPTDAMRLLEDSLQKTFGQLLGELRRRSLVPDGFEARLEAFRENCNWFVHHLGGDDFYRLHDPKYAPGIVDRIVALYVESKDLANAFTDLNEKWCRSIGMTTEELEAAMKEEFHKHGLD